MKLSLDLMSKFAVLHSPDRSYRAYREDVLRGVSDLDIMTLAGEGDYRNLWGILRTRDGRVLRERLSQAIGRIERELSGVNAAEWTVPHHNVLREVFALTVESHPCPRR